MIFKTISDMRTEISTELLNRIPALDLTEGTPERDIFVEAPIAGQLTSMWDKITYSAKLAAPLVYYADLDRNDVSAYMANYGVTLLPKTKSTGTVTFYAKTLPANDIVIPDGTIVQTDGNDPISFAVDGTYKLFTSIAASYYNSITDRWEVNANVAAVSAGPEFKASSNTVIVIAGSILGIDGVVNNNTISGGQPEESVDNGLRRVLAKFQGRGLSGTQGLYNYITGFANDVTIVTAEDIEMERDQGRGKCIDIYVNQIDLSDALDSYTITTTGLENPDSVNYTSTSVFLKYQPVSQIISLSVNGTILSPSSPQEYVLVKDTGTLKNSTGSLDKVVLTTTGLSNYGYFEAGYLVEVTYIYNGLLNTIRDNLYNTENHYINRDYLVREMNAITINISFSFRETAGSDYNTVADAVELAVSEYINALGSNQNVERADIISTAKNVGNVDNINIDTVILINVGGGTKTAQGDIIIGKNQYASFGVITLSRWVS